MSTSTPSELHHLVCRECAFECLLDAASDADALRRDHAVDTGHKVVTSRVA